MTRFSDMPDNSRVWVYQCNRKLLDSELKFVNQQALKFIDAWTAHDMLLKACFEIRYGIFLILFVDEKQAIASGCSIDKSVHFILQLEKELGVLFTNRMLFAYRNQGEEISIVSKTDFEKSVAGNKISDNTIVFNTLVQTKSELENNFEIPFAQSWHKQLVIG